MTYFTSTVSDTICGTMTYTIKNSDNSAIDSSVFTFTTTPSLNIDVTTSDTAKVATYNLEIIGQQGSYTAAAHTLTITIDIIDGCPTATLSSTGVAA